MLQMPETAVFAVYYKTPSLHRMVRGKNAGRGEDENGRISEMGESVLQRLERRRGAVRCMPPSSLHRFASFTV